MVEKVGQGQNYETKTYTLNGIVNSHVAPFITPFVNFCVATFVAPGMEVDKIEQDYMEEWSSRSYGLNLVEMRS